MKLMKMMKRISLLCLLLCYAMPSWGAKEAAFPEQTVARKQAVTQKAKAFMVVAAHPEAVKAGYALIEQGGNAMDAAIAVQMVLNLVEPQSSGIGGGGFLLYYDAKKKQLFAYDGRETAPLLIPEDAFMTEDGRPKAFSDVIEGGLTVGTPGLLALLDKGHKNHGKMQWASLFDRAIALADSGFLISKRMEDSSKRRPVMVDKLRVTAGDRYTNHRFAATLRLIQAEGIKPFYQGVLGKKIVAKIRKGPNPGYLSMDDFTAYRVRVKKPLCRLYRTYRICSVPPPSSGGVTTLEILGILQFFDVGSLHPLSPMWIHIMAEATKIAFKDRVTHIGDTGKAIDFLLEPAYLRKKAQSIILPHDGESLLVPFVRPLEGAPVERENTTHMSIVDKEGNAVSMTSSIEHAFGAGLQVGGFYLNNQLTDFNFTPKGVNKIAAGKRPRSSMAPMMVFDKEGALTLVAGSPGGPHIIPYMVQFIVALLDHNLPLHQAVSLPHHSHAVDKLALEVGQGLDVYKTLLAGWGHAIDLRDLNSGMHAITIRKNQLEGIADPRRDGIAMGQ